MNDRNIGLDIIKVFGLFSALLVHHGLNETFNNLLAYSVPMLVFLSGYLAPVSLNSKDYIDYLKKRLKRIIIPTYLFIFIVLILRYAVSAFFKLEFYSFKEILLIILLSDNSLGFIWISRVFFLLALITPIINQINKIKNNFIFVTFLMSIILIYTVILTYFNINFNSIIFQYTLYMVPYCIIFLIGNRIKINENVINIVFTLISIIFLITLFLDEGFYPSHKKYPPQLQYLAYGLFITLLIFKNLKKIRFKRNNNVILNLIIKISKQSFTIYLVQGFIIIFYNWGLRAVSLKVPLLVEIVIITTLSIVISFIINKRKKCLK